MTITKTVNESELTLALQGRLDTTTAPQLESALKDSLPEAENMEKLVMDFAQLEYVSSAGLRVLLTTQKQMAGKMVIKNVCEDIMEVFEITGFADILTIE